MTLVGIDSPDIPITKTVVWDEAIPPFFCLPVSVPFISFPEGFTKIFSPKKLEASVACDQLMLGIPYLPEDLLSRDLAARQHVLDLWKSVGALSIMSHSDVASFLGSAVNAVFFRSVSPLHNCHNPFSVMLV